MSTIIALDAIVTDAQAASAASFISAHERCLFRSFYQACVALGMVAFTRDGGGYRVLPAQEDHDDVDIETFALAMAGSGASGSVQFIAQDGEPAQFTWQGGKATHWRGTLTWGDARLIG